MVKGALVGVGNCKGQSRKGSNLKFSVDFATDGPPFLIQTDPHNTLQSPLPDFLQSSVLRGTMNALRCNLGWEWVGGGPGES